MDNGGGNGTGCFEVEIWADTAKFTNVIVAGFRKCRDLVRLLSCNNFCYYYGRFQVQVQVQVYAVLRDDSCCNRFPVMLHCYKVANIITDTLDQNNI